MDLSQLFNVLERTTGWTASIDRNLSEVNKKLDEALDHLAVIRRLAERPTVHSPGELEEPDGPVEPLSFRLGGVLFEGFRSVEWWLLACLWKARGRTASLQDAVEQVYGPGAENKEAAIASAQKRLNKKLHDEGAPAWVEQRTGYLFLKQSGVPAGDKDGPPADRF